MSINPKWLMLAGDMLDLAADQFANHGCNDWKYPATWTEADIREFATAMAVWNCGYVDDEEVAENIRGVPDCAVMRFLGEVLKKEISAT